MDDKREVEEERSVTEPERRRGEDKEEHLCDIPPISLNGQYSFNNTVLDSSRSCARGMVIIVSKMERKR